MRISLISVLFSVTIFAEPKNENIDNIEVFEEVEISQIYRMSTVELQKEVEKRTNAGLVSFEMGLELMRRWSGR